MMTQATCKRCQASYKVSVARGLKTSRLCPACRQAERIRKQAIRLNRLKHRFHVRERLRKKAQVRLRARINAKALAGQYGGSSGRKKTSQSRLKCDHEATKAANFLDSSSYIHISGRLLLYGADMSAQRQKVWERDKGICGICGKPCHASLWDLEHIIPRSKGRDDRMENLQISHSMRDIMFACHRNKTGRETQWTIEFIKKPKWSEKTQQWTRSQP